MKKLTAALAILIIFSSCSNYYKAITSSNASPASGIGELQSKNKYFILRNGTSSFAISNIAVAADQKTMQCTLQNLPDEHRLHLTNGERGKMIYKKSGPDENEKVVLQEVHIYIVADPAAVIGPYTLVLDKIQKIEVIEKDLQKTKKSHIVGAIAITGGTLLIVGIIGAAMFSQSMSSFQL
jgi:hypothetical protein